MFAPGTRVGRLGGQDPALALKSREHTTLPVLNIHVASKLLLTLYVASTLFLMLHVASKVLLTHLATCIKGSVKSFSDATFIKASIKTIFDATLLILKVVSTVFLTLYV